ncbi:hypothetical protein ABZ547_22595 [Streptomyces sparsogenes]|uniref:hypothetical protein n=1 Tax=Streptomyces sparsogenes TaxID=67365 RepID=UPI0033FD9EE7
MTHDAPAMRLIERPFVNEDPVGLWPFHLHGLIRATIRTTQDNTDDRWSPRGWTRAAERAFEALGEQWTTSPAPNRLLLIGCLRQGLRLARDFRLELGWLAGAAWAYISDSIWEPLAPPAAGHAPATTGLETAADALVETLSALSRRQHEHRERTVDRLTQVIDTGLLPTDLHEMALYYQAKAQRDLGRTDDSRHGMQQVANGGGRLAPAAPRGLAHLARLAGDFPTALATARTLDWAGRHHRVEGDVWWVQSEMERAAAAYEAARGEAEEHGVAGERATCQAQRAFVLVFTDPALADDELDLAQQLLSGLDLRATRLTSQIASLLRDAGTTGDIEDRASILRTETSLAGLTSAAATLELAMAFHHAVRGAHSDLLAAITRLRELARNGEYAYYIDLAHFMGSLGLPAQPRSQPQWINGEQTTRQQWHRLVMARRHHLGAAP